MEWEGTASTAAGGTKYIRKWCWLEIINSGVPKPSRSHICSIRFFTETEGAKMLCSQQHSPTPYPQPRAEHQSGSKGCYPVTSAEHCETYYQTGYFFLLMFRPNWPVKPIFLLALTLKTLLFIPAAGPPLCLQYYCCFSFPLIFKIEV